VKPTEYYKLDEAVQASNGNPVHVTVTSAEGKTRQIDIHPHFLHLFGNELLNFAGMLPRPAIEMILNNSPARSKLMPGDAIIGVATGTEAIQNPTARELTDWLTKAGASSKSVDITVLRDGKVVTVKEINPNIAIKPGNRWGIGIYLTHDDQHAVVAGTQDKSPARQADIPDGATILAVNGHAVTSWSDVRREMMATKANESFPVKFKTMGGEDKTVNLSLSSDNLLALADLRYGQGLPLEMLMEDRKTTNPAEAARWGVIETRDLVLQFYLTLRKMVVGQLPVSSAMGPVGMVAAGTQLAHRGYDWLIWFLSLISANLAVVNFLPIPIVDGGLFLFLILEKLKGSPLSPRAQSIAQVVGLALLLGVFLLVTYQDINRLF